MLDKDYPQEYIKGEVIFFGKRFLVTPDVLIPRLETETLVRRAREILQKEAYDTLIDIGSGSGIIWTSCAEYARKVIFTDISAEALEVTKKNFILNCDGKSVEFLHWSLFEPIQSRIEELSQVLIVSNLPYIRQDDWGNMSADTHFEPKLALFGWEVTGFELYEEFFRQLKDFTWEDLSTICLIEFGYDQREICENLLKTYGWEYRFFADYAGIERFCEIRT
jgi:release factor glutamine methyltransferase